MQLGSLQFERPPDVQIYLPGFELGKKISPFANGDLGRCPEISRPFEKGRRKLYLPALFQLTYPFTDSVAAALFTGLSRFLISLL